MNESYRKQAALLIRCLPEVTRQRCFALKGGTAINLFVRDMPRLSVDIDLAYLPVQPRAASLADIEQALQAIADDIRRVIARARVTTTAFDGRTAKLLVMAGGVQIKIEPNPMLRGTLFGVEERELCRRAETEFEASAVVRTLSFAELYGGKLCAALDRQHPRDLFDVKLLLDNEGITDDIRKAFVVCLASHARPMNELLAPSRIDIAALFDKQFAGMAVDEVSLGELLVTRDALIRKINDSLMEAERRFLLSVNRGEPDWSLIDAPGIDTLPAIQWKLQNILRMPTRKHREAVDKLRAVLKL